MQLRTKALIIVTVVIAFLFLIMYGLARIIVIDGGGDLGSRVWYFLLISFAIGLSVAFAAVFLIEKIGISLVYNMGEAIRRIRDDNDLSVRIPVAGNDEVSQFAGTINQTLDALEVSRGQLEESEGKYRSLVESINDMVWETDDQLRFTYMSPRVRIIMGYEPGDIAGKSPFELAPKGEKARLVPVIAGMIERQGTFSLVEMKIVRKDGILADLEISGTPITGPTGKITGYRGIVRDISERKRADAALKNAYDELELRVHLRTAELKEANDSLESNVQQRTAELASAVKALQAEVAERKRVERQMLSSLQEKEVLLKEIHHRVKNNLQIISSLLSLQSEKISGQDPVRTFRESQDRIRSMALIHEKLYQARDISRVDFAEYARSLTAYLSRSYVSGPGIEIVIDIEDVSLDIDLAIPCGLIINELVSNSLKYAFPDGRHGEIRIGLSRAGNGYTLVVADNGAGLPPGLDFRDTPSLGLQLVNTLVGQLEGTIELLRGTGTAFRISFREWDKNH
jgi:PAS domain S-box-containing protein